MNESRTPGNRRHFLRGMALGATGLTVSSLFNVRGLFAEQLTLTARQGEGPFYPDHLPLDTDNDLLTVNDGITPAVGQVTHLGGRILTASGEPIRNALVEIWQADNEGIYLHSNSNRDDRMDENFQGFGRFMTGSTGEYYFRTIRARHIRQPHTPRSLRGEDRRQRHLDHAVLRPGGSPKRNRQPAEPNRGPAGPRNRNRGFRSAGGIPDRRTGRSFRHRIGRNARSLTASGTLTRKARRNRPALPLEAETELHHAFGTPGLDDLAGVGLAPIDTRPARVLRNTEVGMVHRVENFPTEPGPDVFTDVEALPQRQIHVDEIRSPALVPGDRAARKGVLEVLPAHAGSGIGAAFDQEHPIVFALLQTERHVAHQVGNGPAEEVVIETARRREIERTTRARLQDTSDFPTADDVARNAGHVATDRSAARERKLHQESSR